MTELRKRIKAGLRRIGIGRRGSTAKRAAAQLLRGLNVFGVDCVFDVGANTGQFAGQIRAAGFAGRIVSFEPLTQAHQELSRASAKDPRWSVHERCALGDAPSRLKINIAGNSVSSSILPMTATHAAAAPGSGYVGIEEVEIITLDSVAPGYLAGVERPFLKIDTQGFEWQVLVGAERTLPTFRGVLCELSLVMLYEGQHLWRDVIDHLETAGFTLWALQPGFMDGGGRNLQVDAIFFRENDSVRGR